MKRFAKVAVTAASVLGAVGIAMPANATPPTGYGFDNSPHTIVMGGSDTTYRAMANISALWNSAPGCTVITAVGATMGQCVSSASADTNNLGNWQHDTLGNANPVGSSSGIASLNGFIPSGQSNVTYPGTVNSVPGYLGSSATGPNADIARSSRGPKTSGGNAIGGNELAVDTFWGFAQDGVEVMSFENRGPQIQSAGGSAMTPAEIYHIYNCDYTVWSQVPSLGIAAGSATDGPIVPWGMNSGSGTYATFNSYLISQGGAPSGWAANNQSCVRKMAHGDQAGVYPLENDIKPMFTDAAADAGGLTNTNQASTDNPSNWLWWGSFGELSTFPYKGSFTITVSGAPELITSTPVPINGILPSSSGILANTYPIGRTLYSVTRKQDADCAKTTTTCDFTNNPGPALAAGGNDLNVTGGTSGISGAVREFTRFLCRNGSAAQATDNYSGKNESSLLTTAINAAGFTVVPASLRTAGSRCAVLS